MVKRNCIKLLWIATLLLTSGCASMMSGTTQPVTFSSSPEGATVTIEGVVLGKTPATITIKKQSTQLVEFEKEGFSKQTVEMGTTFNPWVLGNVIFCMSCVLSTTTDYANGAAYEYLPYHYYVTMVPVGTQVSIIDQKRMKAKSYIIGFYSDIISELSMEETFTDKLQGLYDIMGVYGPSARSSVFAKIKSIPHLSQKDAMKFSEEVVNILMTESSGKK